jgi:PIN domain nuclease of toxin-antitoxin system
VKIIIDTHIFLWVLFDPDRISSNRRTEIETQANIMYLRSISIAELMIKLSIKK